MCGGSNKDDDINLDLAEGQSGDLDTSPKCARSAKTILFILNSIIWLGSCALLAFGIFALVDSPFTRSVLDGNLAITGAAVLIIVGGAGFIISFVGCCGAMTSNKCLILSYVVVLGTLLAILLVGGILGALFTTRMQNAAAETMRMSLKKYDQQNPETKVAKAWDSMQRILRCCGVMSFRDWQNFNPDFLTSVRIPQSCCLLDSNGRPIQGCTTANNLSNFHSKPEDGCHAKVVNMVHMYTPIVGIVGAVVALFMEILEFLPPTYGAERCNNRRLKEARG